jgi:hypothetical protein
MWRLSSEIRITLGKLPRSGFVQLGGTHKGQKCLRSNNQINLPFLTNWQYKVLLLSTLHEEWP